MLSVPIVPLGGWRLRAVHERGVSVSVFCTGWGLDALVHAGLVVVLEIYYQSIKNILYRLTSSYNFSKELQGTQPGPR
jgi:peroxiredoxin family protein